jgi:branched-chain amino acid transport system ATP-binding protein
MRTRGFTVLLVEQNLRLARAVSDRFYAVRMGRIVDTCSSAELAADPDWLHRYLAV